jgi:hypothetical protein
MYICFSFTNISCYDIMSIFHSFKQLNVPKMCHKTVGNLRFRPIKRWDFNHVMWSSLPCILNTRLCRPARRNIVSFLSPSTVHRKITGILMSVFHIKYIYFTEKMCKILILVPLVIKSVSLNAKLNLCVSYCIAISIQHRINESTAEAFSLKILIKLHSVMSETFLVTSAIPYIIHTV